MLELWPSNVRICGGREVHVRAHNKYGVCYRSREVTGNLVDVDFLVYRGGKEPFANEMLSSFRAAVCSPAYSGDIANRFTCWDTGMSMTQTARKVQAVLHPFR